MEKSSRAVFAERLRDVRERLRGLTQAQLAEKAGLPSTSISTSTVCCGTSDFLLIRFVFSIQLFDSLIA